MTKSDFRDLFAYSYLPALSVPDKHFYIMDNPLRSFARQPTPSEDAAGHGGAQHRQDSESERVQLSVAMFGHLTPHSPFTMDSGEISPISGDERSIQPEESVLPSAAVTEQVLRDSIKIPQSRPLDLSSLKDITNPAAKIPNLTHLAALAIWASPSKRLTLSEIYDAIEARYPILKGHKEKKWKDSLRHRLSLKAVFVRVGQSEKGRRGGYWALDVSKGLNETKRPRRQGSGGASAADTTATGDQNFSLSDRDDQGTSDYSDYSHQSSASISPLTEPQALSVSPMLNYLGYHLSENSISAHHGSLSTGSPDTDRAPYSSGDFMLHSVGSPGYSSSQASTSYYSASHGTLEYDEHHSPAPPSLNVSEHFFATDARDAEFDDLDVNLRSGSNISTDRSEHEPPDYDAADDF